MIVANLKRHRGKKIYCAIIVFVGAISLFAWHLVANGGQQKWILTWLAERQQNLSQKMSFASLGEKRQKSVKSQCYELFTDMNKSFTKMRNSTKSRKVLESRIQPEPFPRKILIISRGRSGSSFLGDLFNENKKAFYLFEPLGWTVKAPKLSETKPVKFLKDLYNCKFTEKRYPYFMLKHTSFRRKSKKLSTFPGQCNKISYSSRRCLTSMLKSSCSASSNIVAKVLTHRLPKGGIWGIHEVLDANKNLRIIHLVRDPRRVIASMKKVGWFKRINFTYAVKDVCTGIWDNIKHVQSESAYYEGRYKLVVYREMMLKPFATVVELYDFLKMAPVPENVFPWILQNTMGSISAPSKIKDAYSTSRNSTEVLNRKVDFRKFEDNVIDRYCGDIIAFIEKFTSKGSGTVSPTILR